MNDWMITSKYQRAKCQRISHSPGLHKHLCTQDFFVHFFNVIKFNWKKGKNITAFCLNNSQREHTEEKLFFHCTMYIGMVLAKLKKKIAVDPVAESIQSQGLSRLKQGWVYLGVGVTLFIKLTLFKTKIERKREREGEKREIWVLRFLKTYSSTFFFLLRYKLIYNARRFPSTEQISSHYRSILKVWTRFISRIHSIRAHNQALLRNDSLTNLIHPKIPSEKKSKICGMQ